MNTENYTNGAIMGLTFLAGFSLANLLVGVIASVAMGFVAKGLDALIKLGSAALSDRWRRKYLEEAARAERAEKRVRELLQGQKDAS